MKILAIETATARASLAWFDSETKEKRRCEFDGAGRLSTALIPAVVSLLKGSGKPLVPEIIAVDGGPGSFTGLRIGMAAAKGLAFVNGARLALGCSLDILAAAVGRAGRVITYLDARGGYYYYAYYLSDESGPVRMTDPKCGVWSDVTGSAADVYVGPVAPPVRTSVWLAVWPEAPLLAEMAASFQLPAVSGDDIGPLRPNYVKRGQV